MPQQHAQTFMNQITTPRLEEAQLTFISKKTLHEYKRDEYKREAVKRKIEYKGRINKQSEREFLTVCKTVWKHVHD